MNDDHTPPAEQGAPSPDKIVSEHVTTLHLIGEQLAQVESWMWEHLADVRAAAVEPPADRAALRDRIAQALADEDARTCGYGHGFLERYGADAETDGFVDAVLAALRDRIAEAPADADGWKFADGFKEHSPTWQRYQQLADAVLPPVSRADVLLGAAEVEARPELNVRPLPAEALTADEAFVDRAAFRADEAERLREEHATWRKLGKRNLEQAHEENARLRAEQAATLERFRVTIRRLAAHAVGFQDVLDESDRGPWGKTIAADIAELRRMIDEDAPLSPFYEHPDCGFRWHGRDGMDIPMRDGQPVCPRCELAAVEKKLRHSEKLREELRAESRRRGKVKLEYAERIRRLEIQLDEVRTQLGAEILRAGQAEAELRRMADEAQPDDTVHTCPGRWGGPDCRCFDDEAQPGTEAQQPANPREVCVCGHTRAEHLTVSGRLLCDACDPDSTENTCKEYEAL
ncbi:hypothetical protein [Streptomyces violaceus]|uniref:Uncharacterized protein n=1 Tax=Streptomyces violaceus TaxID=1936 RepID=A0ABZ1NLA2_STRVL